MFGCHSRLVVFSVIGLFSALDMSAEVLKKRSWREAAQYCTLLGSNNTATVQIEKINISSDVQDALYWIGAIVNHTFWFQVLGNNYNIFTSTEYFYLYFLRKAIVIHSFIEKST
eukprot:XP_011427723.1 PREDICTED: uncharacterized protein LOC105328511 [Crassostrea gigas]